MKKEPTCVMLTLLLGTAILSILAYFMVKTDESIPEVTATNIEVEDIEPTPVSVKEEIQHVTQLNPLTDDEMIAKVVMAESEGEEMVGKVAVAMTVLNRCDYYGVTVETAIKTDRQYSIAPTYNEDCMRAVQIAKENRDLYPATMMWFKTDNYHDFGNGNPQDYMPIGNHYFSYLEIKNE